MWGLRGTDLHVLVAEHCRAEGLAADAQASGVGPRRDPQAHRARRRIDSHQPGRLRAGRAGVDLGGVDAVVDWRREQRVEGREGAEQADRPALSARVDVGIPLVDGVGNSRLPETLAQRSADHTGTNLTG